MDRLDAIIEMIRSDPKLIYCHLVKALNQVIIKHPGGTRSRTVIIRSFPSYVFSDGTEMHFGDPGFPEKACEDIRGWLEESRTAWRRRRRIMLWGRRPYPTFPFRVFLVPRHTNIHINI
jgi:hypothetical protein